VPKYSNFQIELNQNFPEKHVLVLLTRELNRGKTCYWHGSWTEEKHAIDARVGPRKNTCETIVFSFLNTITMIVLYKDVKSNTKKNVSVCVTSPIGIFFYILAPSDFSPVFSLNSRVSAIFLFLNEALFRDFGGKKSPSPLWFFIQNPLHKPRIFSFVSLTS